MYLEGWQVERVEDFGRLAGQRQVDVGLVDGRLACLYAIVGAYWYESEITEWSNVRKNFD